MGAVHGVHLKYFGLSAVSYIGYHALLSNVDSTVNDSLSMNRNLLEWNSSLIPLWKLVASSILFYSASLNLCIGLLFKLRRGMGMIGKDPKTGQIPRWSYVVYFPFHGFNSFYTFINLMLDQKLKSKKVSVATEVQPGWYVGGRYSYKLNKTWGGIIDVTCEFPELGIHQTQHYMLISVWDGVPPNPAQLEEAASFAVETRKKGDVLIHCAHGKGRSTTVMCAALVRAGIFRTWQEAFEKGIKPFRPVCKLNKSMRANLTHWQNEYMEEKKGS